MPTDRNLFCMLFQTTNSFLFKSPTQDSISNYLQDDVESIDGSPERFVDAKSPPTHPIVGNTSTPARSHHHPRRPPTRDHPDLRAATDDSESETISSQDGLFSSSPLDLSSYQSKCKRCSKIIVRLQADLKESLAKRDQLTVSLEESRRSVENVHKHRTELELQWLAASQQTESILSGSVEERFHAYEEVIRSLREEHTKLSSQSLHQLRHLLAKQQQIEHEVEVLQRQIDSLRGKHLKHSRELQNEDINLPNNPEEMEMALLKYREEVITVKAASEHLEESLQADLLFLRQQLTSEQEERTTIEESLTHDITSLHEKLVLSESMLEEYKRGKMADSSLAEENSTLKERVGELTQCNEQLDIKKGKLDQEIHFLKKDLDSSEQVQQDLVKLSQSLQVQLEGIRQEDAEVRWEHDEDVTQCRVCHVKLNKNKDKCHCLHCGKIFCTDCLSKTVPSGPYQRPSKVCDRCHTLLQKNAAPYFNN